MHFLDCALTAKKETREKSTTSGRSASSHNWLYEWSNWLFACPNCNRSKSNKWPDDEYVNPCAEDESEKPERFFDFNTTNGEMIPKVDISSEHQRKALQMINDLSLNASYHLDTRADILYLINHSLPLLIEGSEEEQEFLDRIVDRTAPLSSIVRALLTERDFIIDG